MKRKMLIRKIVSAVLIILLEAAAFLLQSILIPAAGISFPVLLLTPLTASVAIFENEIAAMLFGVLAGALTDITLSGPDGLYALVFAVVAFAASAVSKRYLRNTLTVAYLLSAIACFTVYTASLATNYILKAPGALHLIISGSYAPGFIVTAALTPLAYIPVRQIEKIRETAAPARSRTLFGQS